MSCPFPGMDPYIERPDLWPDFHDSLVTNIRGLLQPLLRPKYAALCQDRLYVVEADRSIRPDVSIVDTGGVRASKRSTAVLDADAPAVFEMVDEEMREPLIHIIEPTTGRIVTAIEVLSPANKRPGAGRKSYLAKQRELRHEEANLVEIDLLRGGKHTVHVNPEQLATLQPYRYVVAVTREWPHRNEVYAWPLARRFPRIAVPLDTDEPDVVLDLQAAFTRCWDEGPYPQLLRYDVPPPGEMSPEETEWCRQLLTPTTPPPAR